MRGQKRVIDANGFLTCLGAPAVQVKAHRAHISTFATNGMQWWYDEKAGKWWGRPGSYCRECMKVRYWKGKNQQTDDLVYENATVKDLQDWAFSGDVRAKELFDQWRDDMKNGRDVHRAIDDDDLT